MTRPYEKIPQGILLRVYLTPHSQKERISGFVADADGELYLKTYVNAVPEDNKANVALIKLLAKRIGVAASHIEIVAGFQSRRKKVLLRGVAEEKMLEFIELNNEKALSG